MAAAKKRVKNKAAQYVPTSRAEVDAAIAQIGVLQRQRETIETKLNDRLARIKSAAETDAGPIAESIRVLASGVQTWCEANRNDLLKAGGKTVKFGNGEVRWRKCPPSVSLKRVEDLIKRLKADEDLKRFVRSKDEVDKEAILADASAVEGIVGITINTDLENFVIAPFATKLEEVAP